MIRLLLLFAVAAPAETWRNPVDGMEFVRVPAGSAVISCQGPRCPGSRVVHVEFPEGFWIGRTEVTVGQFRIFVDRTGYRTTAERNGARFNWKNTGFPQAPDHPVVYMSFPDAVAYAEWAGVSIPTEAEWEHARRARTTTKFYWGDSPSVDTVWHRENSPDGTHPVATKPANPWGLYDVIGNAWEWCRIVAGNGEPCEFGTPRGGSWTRCPEYKFRDGRLVDAFSASVPPISTECAKPGILEYDDDRGFRCIRRIKTH